MDEPMMILSDQKVEKFDAETEASLQKFVEGIWYNVEVCRRDLIATELGTRPHAVLYQNGEYFTHAMLLNGMWCELS
jgi:hypothetical protein